MNHTSDTKALNIKDYAQQALLMMDLTSLTDSETADEIKALCQQAKSPAGNTAAICIYPRFIPMAKKFLAEQGTADVKIATVTNFPHGRDDIAIAVAETKAAVAYGADEVDVVFPYNALKQGNTDIGFELVKACKAACGDNVQLKVIIESGELATESLIKQASELSIKAGADFIKTSTGKVSVNATPEAAKIMLSAIKEHAPHVGFKPAGGVKSAEDAKVYLDMATEILGSEWLTKARFRFGASSLLANLLNTLGHQTEKQATTSY